MVGLKYELRQEEIENALSGRWRSSIVGAEARIGTFATEPRLEVARMPEISGRTNF